MRQINMEGHALYGELEDGAEWRLVEAKSKPGSVTEWTFDVKIKNATIRTTFSTSWNGSFKAVIRELCSTLEYASDLLDHAKTATVEGKRQEADEMKLEEGKIKKQGINRHISTSPRPDWKPEQINPEMLKGIVHK